MKPIFTPEDFDFNIVCGLALQIGPVDACNLANAKINKLIDSAPVVYAPNIKAMWNSSKTSYDTHRARLMFIEEIEKEECKHRPRAIDERQSNCIYCNIELIAEWKPRNTSEGL